MSTKRGTQGAEFIQTFRRIGYCSDDMDIKADQRKGSRSREAKSHDEWLKGEGYYPH